MIDTKEMLTREQILSEPAGQQMDAWIAEYILDWSPADVQNCIDAANGSIVACSNFPNHLPDYSTDIGEAFKLLKSNRPTNGYCSFLREYQMSGRRTDYGDPIRLDLCCFAGDGSWFVEATAETEPLAICRALLLARFGFHWEGKGA